jgi:hypothetical protein
MRLPSEFGIQRHAQVFGCVLIRNSVMVDINWLVLDTLVGEIELLYVEDPTSSIFYIYIKMNVCMYVCPVCAPIPFIRLR